MNRTRPMIAFVLCAGLLLGACGTTEDKAEDSAESTSTSAAGPTSTRANSTTTTEPDTTTTEPIADAVARAGAANLLAEDFTEEWTPQPHQESADPNIIEVCAPQIDLEATTEAKAESPDFTKGDLNVSGQVIQSSTRVFKDEAAATEAVSVFGDPAFVACGDKNVKDGFTGAAVTGTLTPQPGIETVADQVEAMLGNLSVTVPDTPAPVPVEIAIIAVRTGDVATVITGLSVGGPGDDVLGPLVDTVAERQAG